jgi:uncharacterized peroxidase-related enzyme
VTGPPPALSSGSSGRPARGTRRAELDPRPRAILEYADKLTREPWAVREEDVAALRTAGLTDSAILDVAQVTAYYAYVNRLADGLGVELEGFWGEE